MHSLSTIPEPCCGTPAEEPIAAHHPLITAPIDSHPHLPSATPPKAAPTEEVDHQIDHIAVLLILMIAAGLLRIVLGLLGPMQGVDPLAVQQAHQQGQVLVAGDPVNAYPLFDLFWVGVSYISAPAWSLVLIGSLLTFIAVPAAYIIGQTLTGRPAAGILAAAVVAVHPAVLTASNSFASPAIALGLVTLGLAMVCQLEKRGLHIALAGAILLGLAGLAAPLCWLIGAFAGPMTYKLALRRGAGKAVVLGLLATLLAVTPAATYRATLLGTDVAVLFPEWANDRASANLPSPMDRLLVTMVNPSFEDLGQAMHLPLGDAGRLKISSASVHTPRAIGDPVADVLADGWLLLNAALGGLAAISLGIMLARRRLAEVLLLAIPLLAMAFCTLPPGETLRIPMLTMVGVLSTGMLATRSVPRVDQAVREAKRLAKLAKQEEKERAKQERDLQKHKESLFAFDQPTKSKQNAQVRTASRADDASQLTQGILTQHEDDAPPLSARPI